MYTSVNKKYTSVICHRVITCVNITKKQISSIPENSLMSSLQLQATAHRIRDHYPDSDYKCFLDFPCNFNT